MQIRKNTKEHSAIFEVLKKHESDKQRNKLIKIFTLKAGEPLEHKKPVEEAKELSDLYYNLNYNSILNNLLDKEHQLNKSEEEEDLYYFESNYTPVETPFQLTSKVLEEINALLKDKKFKARAPKALEERTSKEEEEEEEEEQSEKEKDTPAKVEKEVKVIRLEQARETNEKKEKKASKVKEKKAEPSLEFDLKYDIPFTNLSERLFENPVVTKGEVLTYYYAVLDQMLPFLQNHLLFKADIDSILKSNNDHPDWLKTANVFINDIEGEFLVGHNKEHILFMVEKGIIQIDTWSSKNKNLKNPSFLTITIEDKGAGLQKLIRVVQSFKEILDICELDGFVKTTGQDGLSIHILLDGKSDYSYSRKLSELLCKLASKKEAAITSLIPEEKSKFYLDVSSNSIGKTFIAPYSLNETTFRVAIPLDWSEVDNELDLEVFTLHTILDRLDKKQAFTMEKLPAFNAKEVFEKLDRRYGFLLE